MRTSVQIIIGLVIILGVIIIPSGVVSAEEATCNVYDSKPSQEYWGQYLQTSESGTRARLDATMKVENGAGHLLVGSYYKILEVITNTEGTWFKTLIEVAGRCVKSYVFFDEGYIEVTNIPKPPPKPEKTVVVVAVPAPEPPLLEAVGWSIDSSLGLIFDFSNWPPDTTIEYHPFTRGSGAPSNLEVVVDFSVQNAEITTQGCTANSCVQEGPVTDTYSFDLEQTNPGRVNTQATINAKGYNTSKDIDFNWKWGP